MEEDLQLLELKVKQLKLDYEQYFSGARPREPAYGRSDVQKQVALYSSTPIKNTSLRFKFNSINARFQAFKRHWDLTLRKIENGTHRRDVFRADLHDRERRPAQPRQSRAEACSMELFRAYREAARSCGLNVDALTPAQLSAAIAKQEERLRKQLRCERVSFRVAVEDGRVKLKASPVGAGRGK